MTDKQRRAMFARQGGKGAPRSGNVITRFRQRFSRKRLKDLRLKDPRGGPARTAVSAGQRRGARVTSPPTQPGPSPRGVSAPNGNGRNGFEAFYREHEGLVGRAVRSRAARLGLPRGGDLEKELRQEGAIALWNAKRAFDPKKGKWSTFATRHIEGALGRTLKKQGPVTLGEREVRRRARAGKPVMELAGLSAVERERESRGGLGRTEARLRAESLLKGYSERDRAIVTGVLGEGRSQGELAKKFKLSKARVNQIIGKIRKEIRKKEAA